MNIRAASQLDQVVLQAPHVPVSLKVLVTGRRLNTTSLSAFMGTMATGSDTNILNQEKLRSILFQIIYTLHVMVDNGFQHNDLHLNNILIDLDPEEVSTTYQLSSGDRFTVSTELGKVLMFDWDNGVCQSCGPNSSLEAVESCRYQPCGTMSRCATTGVCSSINPRFDLYTLMTQVRSMVMTMAPGAFIDFEQFFNEFVSNTSTTDTNNLVRRNHAPSKVTIHERFPSRMCNLNADGLCEHFAPNQPQFIKTPEEMLHSDYFKLMHDDVDNDVPNDHILLVENATTTTNDIFNNTSYYPPPTSFMPLPSLPP